jgi:tetratricopeptide (TPR) repeat protein
MNDTSLLHHAIQLHQSGSLVEAERLYGQVLERDPTCAHAWCYLGVVQVQRDCLDAAATSLQNALYLLPQFPEAHCNLGTVFLYQGKVDRAIDCYKSALRFQPNLADAHSNLGKAYLELRRYSEAEANSRRALELAPEHADAWANLGSALQRLGRLDEALACCQKAVGYQPQSPDAHLNLGAAFSALARTKEAVAAFEEALRLRPGFPDAHWGRSLALLMAGDFEHGWPEYEWRWQCKPFPSRPFPQLLWDGSPLGGKTIYIYAEQGLGDTIQFVRYAPLVKQRGGRVILACHDFLVPLLRSCKGIDELLPLSEAAPRFDVHAALMSLPMLCGTTLATVPDDVPYLSVGDEFVEQWRRELGRLPGFKVGIAWQGDPSYSLDALRSIPLRQFASIARVPEVSLVGLQKGLGTSQLAEVKDLFRVEDWAGRLDAAHGAFMDTAAIMKGLDLVICSDSAVAHLAGALEVPVWVALPSAAEFRWLLDREDSPWYPTMRLFRQRTPGDWPGVFDRLAESLSSQIRQR